MEENLVLHGFVLSLARIRSAELLLAPGDLLQIRSVHHVPIVNPIPAVRVLCDHPFVRTDAVTGTPPSMTRYGGATRPHRSLMR